MDFLNKLYESDYFGIGLFAVISFLVVTFLVVLFFGKKDEKKRKLEATNQTLKINETENTFKETSVETPIEMPAAPDPIVAPVMPINVEPVIAPIEPIAPINFESEPIQPVAPINYEEVKIEEPMQFVDNLTIEESKPIESVGVINEPITPIIEPVNIEPIKLEPIKYEIPVESQLLEPVKINLPEEPISVEPIIKEEEPPIVTPIVEPAPIIEEPVINTYYQPIEKNDIREVEEISVPNIDFDALAESISKELDELEKNTNRREYEEVKVTPIEEVTSRPTNQFSSVYINKPAAPIMKETIDLPKKIDLPTMKSGEIEPENYTI